MCLTNKYSCKIFLKNLQIQKEIVIDNDTQIVPSSTGYTCYDSAVFMTSYLKTVTGENVNIDVEEMAKEYSQKMPVCIIKLWNVEASSLESASDLASKKSQSIIKFLAYNQGQLPEVFGVTASRKGEGTFVSVLPVTYCSWKIHLMDNINTMARYITSQSEKDERLNLFLTLFSEAISENNLDFKIAKLWTILETISIPYKGNKEEKVRELLREYNIGIREYDEDFDLIKLAYKHRNAIVHEGTSDPKLASSKYVKYLTVSNKNLPSIMDELEELTSFVIRLYIRRTSSQ